MNKNTGLAVFISHNFFCNYANNFCWLYHNQVYKIPKSHVNESHHLILLEKKVCKLYRQYNSLLFIILSQCGMMISQKGIRYIVLFCVQLVWLPVRI